GLANHAIGRITASRRAPAGATPSSQEPSIGDAQLAAHGLVAETEPLLDRALDEPRDATVGSLEQQAIRATATPREHAEPGQEPPRGRLALDDEQLVDRAHDEAPPVIANLDRRVVDVDRDLDRQHPARRDRDDETQDRL